MCWRGANASILPQIPRCGATSDETVSLKKRTTHSSDAGERNNRQPNMLIDEERECSVCFQEYSRSDRIPRTLHCEHTFCSRCLQRICRTDTVMYYVSCPLCRWVTCSKLTLPGSLYVNTTIWDELTEKQQEVKDR